MTLPEKLIKSLSERKASNSLRSLSEPKNLTDFSSNDYLGFSKSASIFKIAQRLLADRQLEVNGATGSRLLSGNHQLYPMVEARISDFHKSDAALIYNSGYNANLGFFSAVPQRGDVILYDELSHASIRDGLTLSLARHYKFAHNDIQGLEELLIRHQNKQDSSQTSCTYVVTESVFSMDGDSPDLKSISSLCQKYQAYLIVDEAHAIGVVGKNGHGLVQELKLEHDVFARLVTFGKALGCHGAAILASHELRDYLINFSRAFIYTTALPPHSVATISAAYKQLSSSENHEQKTLLSNIKFFKSELLRLNLNHHFIQSNSAIQSCILVGNDRVKHISEKLAQAGFDVKAILAPTVPKQKERLRFCLHAFNTPKEISEVLTVLSTFVS